MSDRKIWLVYSESVDDFNSIFSSVAPEAIGSGWTTTNLTPYFNLPPYHDNSPSIVQLSNGTLFLTWSSDRIGNYEIFYKTSIDLGASWSADKRLTDNFSIDANPSVAQLSNGTIFVTWSSDRTGNDDLYYKTYNGTTWSRSDKQLTNSTSVDRSPSAILLKDGRIMVSWNSMRTGNYEIFYKFNAGSAWTAETQFTNRTDLDMNPSVMQTVEGTIYIFWSSAPDDLKTDDLWYAYSTDGAVTWSPAVRFTTSGYEDAWPSAIQTKDTRIWVAWTSDRSDQPDGNYDVWYRYTLVGDLDNSNYVDIDDLIIVSRAFGSIPGQPDWNPNADVNSDGRVDIDDLILVARDYGLT